MPLPIYLDFNATTPLADEVAAAMASVLVEPYGNPSSLHWAGMAARAAVETARGQVADFIGCSAGDVVFTSGGTEANNQAIKGLFFAAREKKKPFHVITSSFEHPAVVAPCCFLERQGAEVTLLPVSREGLVDPDDVRRAIGPHTALISIMHANNEVGTIQPLAEIGAIARACGVLLHTDAAQTVGKIPVLVDNLGVDLLSIAGHKLYGPKGVGALYVRSGVSLEPFMHGAGHEAGRRAGTENIAAIVGLGVACQIAAAWLDSAQIVELRDALWQALQSAFGDRVLLHGHPTKRLPNTLNIGFRGLVGSEILARLPHIAASTGSACHAEHVEISPVLKALRVPQDSAIGAIRFSLGRQTARREIELVVESLIREIAKPRALADDFRHDHAGT